MSQKPPLPGWSQCWVGLDVTEHREAVERLKGLFDSSSDGLAFATLEGKLIEANRAFLEIIGRAREDVLGVSYQSLMPPEYRAANTEIVENLVKSGQPAVFQREYVRKDGSRIPVALTLFLVRGSDEKPIGVGSILKPKT
jgi:PAS domain S-box-containing protein